MSNARGGFGGRGGGGGGGGGGASRATGRGQPDDADVVQGRPALEARFELPTRHGAAMAVPAPITPTISCAIR
ncbi:MAG: hypothetical protein M5U09_19390 [Gammaproteobacteria bacterium]|nr:hypothetical protein [Gammaproteobacteria bacterium]